LYAHLRTLVSPGNFDLRIMKLGYLSPGTFAWQSYIYNSLYANDPKGKGSLTTDASFVYSCQVNKAETYVFKINIATGALVTLRELSTTGALDCDLLLHRPAGTKLLLAVHYGGLSEGQVDILKIDTATMNLE